MWTIYDDLHIEIAPWLECVSIAKRCEPVEGCLVELAVEN